MLISSLNMHKVVLKREESDSTGKTTKETCILN